MGTYFIDGLKVTEEEYANHLRNIGLEYDRSRRDSWPILLQPLKLMAKPYDRGAGDIIARVIGPIGGDAFKVWYKATFGRDCGCGNRQDALNRRWPL